MEQHFINSNYNKSALLWFVLEKKMHHRNNNTATVVHMLHTDHGVKYSLFKSPDRRNIYLKHFCFFVFFLCEQQWQKQKDIFIFNNKKYATAHTCMSKCCVYCTLHTDHGVKCSLLKPLTDVRFIWDTAFLFYFFMWTATTQAERYICFKFLKKFATANTCMPKYCVCRIKPCVHFFTAVSELFVYSCFVVGGADATLLSHHRSKVQMISWIKRTDCISVLSLQT